MKILGIDIGFGFTKATDGDRTLIFKSIFGDANDLQFWADFGESAVSDHFHVTINGRSFFVGGLAEQQSNVRYFTLNQDQLIADFIKILALSAAGVFIDVDGGEQIPLNVVSGLPIGYYRMHNKRFSQILVGQHTITYHRPNGGEITRDIYINKVRMLPQPLGSVLNLLMHDNGRIEDADLARQKIAVVDIGFRTTDFTILDRLRYVDRGSRTIDAGISKSFSVMAEKIREHCGVSIELYRLFDAVAKGCIKVRGETFDFSGIRDRIFQQLATAIATEMDRIWSEDWDIDTILLSGGGSMELGRYLRPLIQGQVRPMVESADARLNNVLGYIKYGRHLWDTTNG